MHGMRRLALSGFLATGRDRLSIVVTSVHAETGMSVAAQGQQFVLRQGPNGVQIEAR